MRKISTLFIIITMVLLAACNPQEERPTNTKQATLTPSQVEALSKGEIYPDVSAELEVIYDSLSSLEKDSTHIVRVKIEGHEVVDPNRYPETYSKATTLESIKGEMTRGQGITTVEAGGYGKHTLGEIPVMSTSDEYVLFLIEYKGYYYVTGAFQGRFILKDGYAVQQGSESAHLKDYVPQPQERLIEKIRSMK